MRNILHKMNTTGEKFRFTGFGESHGVAVGGVIDGCPAGVRIDMDAIQRDLSRRAGRTGDLPVSMRAKGEEDTVEWLSGLMDGVTLGTPIAFFVRNREGYSEDYDNLRDVFRPGHADYTYHTKYGIRDWRGGGRASARETAARVVAGAIAKQILSSRGIHVEAVLSQVGEEQDSARFAELIRSYQQMGDSIGGIVSCRITGVPAGVGEPIFGKVQARLAAAMFSIQACKGFDYGSGFEGVGQPGSVANAFSGGMLGGITDGTDITFRCVFKPTPSISLSQEMCTIDGDMVTRQISGRHDPCVAVRAVPVVEAMAAITMLDMLN